MGEFMAVSAIEMEVNWPLYERAGTIRRGFVFLGHGIGATGRLTEGSQIAQHAKSRGDFGCVRQTRECPLARRH